MSLDISTAAAIMKHTYPNGVVEMDYKGSKTLLLLKKRKGTLIKTPFGTSFDVPVKHGNPQAGSATYATGYGQASSENTRYSSWAVTPGTFWHFADINGDIVRRGEGAGSFVDALKSEIENSKMAMRRIYETMLFKGGFGDFAQLSSAANVGSATGVVLANKWMVRMVEKGQKFVFASTEGASVLRGTTAAKVVGRHAAAGTLDFDIAPNTAGTAAANSDWMFREGDRQNSATPTRIVPVGFKAWVPTSAPSSTAFFGVDRTVDDRLGGLRLDATLSGSPREAFMDGNALVQGEGGEITHFVMGRDTYNKLAKDLSNDIEYCDIMTDVGIGVAGFRLNGSDAVFYWDSACEEGISYGYNIEEIEIRYAGEDLFTLVDDEGLMFRRVAGSDLWRSELVTCSQLIMPAPGHAVVIYNL